MAGSWLARGLLMAGCWVKLVCLGAEGGLVTADGPQMRGPTWTQRGRTESTFRPLNDGEDSGGWASSGSGNAPRSKNDTREIRLA